MVLATQRGSAPALHATTLLCSCHSASPCRDALWRVLFWQPLLQGTGLLLVTLLALAGALWASLQGTSLWQLLRWAAGAAWWLGWVQLNARLPHIKPP